MNPSASKNVRLYGDRQLGMSMLMLWGSAYLTWVAINTTDIVMSPDIYGEWVTHFQAESWSIPIMLASILHIIGIKINGRWRWSPALRSISCAVQSVMLVAFVLGARSATMGDPVVVFGIGFAILYIWFTMINIGDLSRSIKSW